MPAWPDGRHGGAAPTRRSGRPPLVAGARDPSRARPGLREGEVVRVAHNVYALPAADVARCRGSSRRWGRVTSQRGARVGLEGQDRARPSDGHRRPQPPSGRRRVDRRALRTPAGQGRGPWSHFAGPHGDRLRTHSPLRRSPRRARLSTPLRDGDPRGAAGRGGARSPDWSGEGIARHPPGQRRRGQPLRVGAARDRRGGPRTACDGPGSGRAACGTQMWPTSN